MNLIKLIDDCLAVIDGTLPLKEAAANQGVTAVFPHAHETKTLCDAFLAIYYCLPCSASMTDFIDLLKHVEEDDAVTKYPKYFCQQEDSPNTRDALIEFVTTSIAAELLISPYGGCNWKNIDTVRNSGFAVFAGEKDSFGWLTGCISTNKGIFVYG